MKTLYRAAPAYPRTRPALSQRAEQRFVVGCLAVGAGLFIDMAIRGVDSWLIRFIIAIR